MGGGILGFFTLILSLNFFTLTSTLLLSPTLSSRAVMGKKEFGD